MAALWELINDQRKSYGPAFQTYCEDHGHEPSSEVDCEGPCFICKHDISYPVRKCIDSHSCNPNLGIHRSCAKLPSTMEHHPFHSQHTLTLHTNTAKYSRSFICDACGRISWGLSFHCERCNFDLDPHCATSLTAIKRPGENRIQNLIHPHSLMLCLRDSLSNLPCSGCKKPFTGPYVYVCLECHCLLHESYCDHDWPSSIEHGFHSQHTLYLHIQPRNTDTSQNWCNACSSVLEGYFYQCYLCNFSLDLSCSLLKPNNTKTMLLKHPHQLITCENLQISCQGCKKCCKGCVYVCLHCRCVLDESCVEWPQQIDHPFHPNHPLTLRVKHDPDCVKHDPDSSRCKACGKGLHGLFFYCSKCEFGLDLVCASLMPPQINQHHQLGHPHPLTLCKKKENFDFTCYACQLQIKDSVYVCLECHILLHRSCANLPRKVYWSPHHEHSGRCQKHTLTLLDHLTQELESPLGSKQSAYMPEMQPLHPKYNGDIAQQAIGPKPEHEVYELDDRSRYSKFLGITTGFAYACSKCPDCFDVRCTMEKSKPHKHPIAFFNTTSNKLNCETCRRSLHTPFFRCEECNFNIHVSCVPILPQIVKHRCHRHILSLRYSPIKYYPDEDENAEFYCNVCEELRDLIDPTYYCVDCHFVSHVHCAFSEEMHVLLEEWSLPFKIEESLSSVDEAMGASVEELEAEGLRFSRNRCSLIELDEKIAELDGEIKRQKTELSAMHERKKELERRRAEFWNYLEQR